MDELWFLLLGWLLGILAPGIVYYIHRKYFQKEIIASSLAELKELQHTMAMLAYMIRLYFSDLTDEFMNWLHPIVAEYDGPEARPELIETLARTKELDEETRAHFYTQKRRPSAALSLIEYTLPFIEASSALITSCPIDFQRRLSRIRAHVEIYNQKAANSRTLFYMTFDASIIDNSRQSLNTNLDDEYKYLQDRAEIIVKAISNIRDRYE